MTPQQARLVCVTRERLEAVSTFDLRLGSCPHLASFARTYQDPWGAAERPGVGETMVDGELYAHAYLRRTRQCTEGRA